MNTRLLILLLSLGLLPARNASAATHTWTGGGASQNWSSVANWSGGLPLASEAAPVILIFPAEFSGPFTNNIANLKVDEIRLLGWGQILRGANGVSLTLRGGHTATNLYSAGENTLDASLPLVLEGTNHIVAATQLTFLNQINGNGSLALSGAGWIIFDGNTSNTYTGVTQSSATQLRLNKSNGAVAIPGDLIVGGGLGANNSRLVYAMEPAQIAATATVTIKPTGKLLLTSGNQTVAGIILQGGEVDSASATLILNGNVTALASDQVARISGKLSLNGAPRRFDVASGLAAPALEVSAIISGAQESELHKGGLGELRLSGANTYPGATWIEAGILSVHHSAALGAAGNNNLGHSTVVGPGATLVLNSVNIGLEHLYLWDNGHLGTGALFNQAGSNSWAGNIQIMSPTVVNVMSGSSLNLAGKITGAGDLTKWGGGTLKLSGSTANDFVGQTRIEGGSLQLAKQNHSRAVPRSLHVGAASGPPVTVTALSNYQFSASQTTLTLQPGCGFNVNQSTQHISGLSGAGQVQLSGQLELASGTYGGEISGAGTLLVSSADHGGLRLTGTNTFTGQAYVDFANLYVDGVFPAAIHALPAGGVGGSGIVGNVDISLGRLTPGVGHYGTGHLRTGHFALTNGSTFRFETRDAPNNIYYDRVEVTGTVKLDNANLELILGSSGRSNIAYILILNDGTDAVQGTFNGLPEGASFTHAGGEFEITYQGGTGNDVVLRQRTPTTNSFPVTLTIQPKDANWVTLSWPSYASGYQLQYCTNLTTAVWWPAGPLSGSNDGTNVIVNELTINRPNCFFRLAYP